MCNFVGAYAGSILGCFINGLIIGSLVVGFMYSLVNAIIGWVCQRLHPWFCMWLCIQFCWCFCQEPCG